MKAKLLTATILFTVFAQFGFSQIKYGARISGGMTNITEVNDYSVARAGFQLGAMAQIPLTSSGNIWFFQPEINYSMQGELNNTRYQDGSRQKHKRFLNYLNIPLNAKLYFTDSETEFFALAGPYIGFKVGDNFEDYDAADLASFDFGLNAGIGYSINRQYEFSLRFSYGLVDQVKNDWGDKTNSNSVLNLGFAYFF